jgi:hypothetical protein
VTHSSGNSKIKFVRRPNTLLFMLHDFSNDRRSGRIPSMGFSFDPSKMLVAVGSRISRACSFSSFNARIKFVNTFMIRESFRETLQRIAKECGVACCSSCRYRGLFARTLENSGLSSVKVSKRDKAASVNPT